jgi:hypothetical protein
MFYQVIHTICGSLPPPVTNSPEDRARRDNAAIAQIACLLPANADEANIAAQYVAASAQALDCLRLARAYPSDEILAMKCTAQAASMMRQARGARSLLMRVQAQREKREADNASLDRANWTEHCAIGLMADALGRTAPEPMAEPPQADIAAEADQYVIRHRKRAALIRSLGRLPDKLDFGPLSPELVRAIVTGTSLQSLDTKAMAA